MSKTIEYIYSKKEVREMIHERKVPLDVVVDNDFIEKKKKPKSNNPQMLSWQIELLNSYKIHFRSSIDNEFPDYAAILMKANTLIFRLDYHDPHRRNCKKYMFDEIIANDLHMHIYCIDCVKDGFPSDSFVLDISKEKIKTMDFIRFIKLFCMIINLENSIKCEAILEMGGLFND